MEAYGSFDAYSQIYIRNCKHEYWKDRGGWKKRNAKKLNKLRIDTLIRLKCSHLPNVKQPPEWW